MANLWSKLKLRHLVPKIFCLLFKAAVISIVLLVCDGLAAVYVFLVHAYVVFRLTHIFSLLLNVLQLVKVINLTAILKVAF